MPQTLGVIVHTSTSDTVSTYNNISTRIARCIAVGVVSALLLLVGATDVLAQLPIRTRQLQLISNNNVNSVRLQAPDGVSVDWTLLPPLTVGSTGSLPYSVVTGASAQLNWLGPDVDGAVLTMVGGVPAWTSGAWLLDGNPNAAAASFLGPTNASVPLNFATANAVPGSMDWYLGPVAPGNLRMQLSTASGLEIGNGTNAVNTTIIGNTDITGTVDITGNTTVAGTVDITGNTSVTGTLTSTGTTTLATAPSASVTALNGVTPGSFSINGIPQTSNVTMTSLGGITKVAIPLGYDRIVVADATGALDEVSIATIVGEAGWLLEGNSNALATNFVGPTTASIPLNFATANAVPGAMDWYLGPVAPANLRMQLSTASGLEIGNGTNAVNTTIIGNTDITGTVDITGNTTVAGTVDITGNTSVTGTLSSTGTTTLASAASSNVTALNAVTPGTFTVNGTPLTSNVRLSSIGGVTKIAIPIGYDRVVIANATGDLDEVSISTIVGEAAWLLDGNSNALATNFVGPTTASIPLNFATANAVPGAMDWYLGPVAPANLRMQLSTASGLEIGNGTNAVNTTIVGNTDITGTVDITGNTSVTGTLSSTGTTTLASAASSNVTALNAVTPGTFTVNGTPLTSNVRLSSIGGVTKIAIPVGYDRVVIANATGDLDEVSISTIVGEAAWLLDGNSNALATNFVGPTTASIPLNFATANAVPGAMDWYLGPVAPANLRMQLSTASGLEIGNGTNAVNTTIIGNTDITGTVDITGNTSVTGTLSSTGTTTLASAASSNVTALNAVTPGTFTVNGTPLTSNVRLSSIGGVTKIAIPVGYDRVVIANATGDLDEVSISTIVGEAAWLLDGNSNALATNFVGPTTASIPLNFATANAVPGAMDWYLGPVAPANLRMQLSTASGLEIGNGANAVNTTITGNTSVTGTLSSTGTTTLASAASSNVTALNAVTPGTFTVNGTPLTSNVRLSSIGGVTKIAIPVGYDRVVIANATGDLDEVSISTIVGEAAWLLDGNSNALATNFVGPTTASIPLNFATANAVPGAMDWYLGPVAPANLRMQLSTASGLEIGNGTNAVNTTITGNTSVTGTLSSTGTTTLASAASSNVTALNAVTPGTFTVNGTPLTSNVRLSSIGGVTKIAIPVGYDRVVIANATGDLDEVSISTIVGEAAWLLDGNSNALSTNFVGPTTASIPLNFATANAVPGAMDWYLGPVAPANLRMQLSTASGLEIGNGTNAVNTTITGNTSVTGTLSSTGTATLASAASSNVTALNAVTPGTFTVNGTPLTSNVRLSSIGGVTKIAIPVGYDRVVIANATGDLDEVSISTIVGEAAWLLDGNSNALATNFVGPTTASIPLNFATANAVPGAMDWYLGPVAPANLRMQLSTASGLEIGNGTNAVNTTITGNTAITGTLSSTGTTTLASAASANVTALNAVTPGTFTVNGTPLTSNVRLSSIGGVTKIAIPVGYDRVVIANATGDLDEVSISTIVGEAAWLLDGNSNALATNFVGPTTASIPLNFATANAVPGAMDWYLGPVAPANLRMQLSTASGFEIGNGTNAVNTTITGNTSVTGTLSSTGTTTLASAASSNVTALNAVTPGTFTVNGTALTPNVTMSSLGGVAKVAIPGGYDRLIVSNAAGTLDEVAFSTLIGGSAWLLAGNSNSIATDFVGPTTASIPLNFATANAVPGTMNWYLGTVAAGNLRMDMSVASGLRIGNATNAVNTAITGNTSVAGTLSSTGTTTLASAASANATILGAVTPGTLTVNGTALTPNVTLASLGGVAKVAVPGGYDRLVIANNTGSLDEVSFSTLIGGTAWLLAGNSNSIATDFVGPTTASIPLNFATANAVPGSMNWYLGTVAAGNLRMDMSVASGLRIGNATNAVNTAITGNTSVTGTLSSTGTTTLASAASANATILGAVTPGTLTINGTALTPNVTMSSLGGVAKVAIPGGYDRLIVSNAAGTLDEVAFSTLIGGSAWLLAGNSNSIATDFVGPTTASIPLNFATANAVPGSMNWYLGTVAAGNLRMDMSVASGLRIGNATNAVNTAITGNTSVTGTLSSTGTTTLASAASANATILGAVTPGTLTINGTALTPNVTMSSLGGVAKVAIPGGYDRLIVSNAAGTLDEVAFSTLIGGSAWLLAGNSNSIATDFVGPTTASIPLNFATANAVPGSMNWYLGTVAAGNLRMDMSVASGLRIGNATNAVNTAITGNTSVTGTLSSTGTTTLASAASANATILGAVTPGTLTINGTALTPNVTMSSLGGVAKVAIPGGYDRLVIANNTGSLDEVSFSTLIGGSAWLLAGNSNAVATNFVGPTTASIPLNFATANAVPGTMNWYLGTVAAGNLRMDLSVASGLNIGNATNAVNTTITGNTAVTGTLSSTGTTTLASAASSNVTALNAGTPGTFTINGTALTPNVTMSSLGGVAKVAIPGGYDRLVIANNTGSLDEVSFSTLIGGSAWLLAGNANAVATNFVGPTTASIPLNFATANAVPGTMNWYLGTVAAGNLRMDLSVASGLNIGNATNAVNTTITGNTAVTGTLSSTGTTTLASAASSNVTALNAGTPGTFTINGTALTPNVTMSSLGGVAKVAIPGGYDRLVIANNTGSLDEVSFSTLIGGSAWLLAGNANAVATNFVGPTTASIPLNFATANAVPGTMNWYLGTVAAGNLRMDMSVASGLRIGNATNAVNTAITGNTSVTGTLSSTGTTTLATAASSNATILGAVTPGTLTVNGTALTPNVTLASLGGVAKVAVPGGYDRLVIANNTGSLDEVSFATLIGGTAWLLAGNSNSIATDFVGPTTASIPLNFATANAVPGSQNWYLGTVAAGNLRMSLSTGAGFQIGNATNSVATSITGTLTSTGTTALATAASSNATILGAVTPGTLTVNGTALTPNVTLASLGGVAKVAIPGGYDRVVIANNTGLLDEVSVTTLLNGAWLLTGNATATTWNGTTGSYLGTTSTQPLSIATTNATAQDIYFYSGANGATKRIEIDGLSGNVGIGNITPQVSMDVDGGVVYRPAAVTVAGNNQTVTPGNRSYIVLDPNGANRTGLILANGLQAGQILILRIIETAGNSVALPDNAANNVDLTGNWIGAANDNISLIWTGTDWVETSRSNN